MSAPIQTEPTEAEVSALARADFAAYIAAFWPKFQLPPHVELLVEKFEAVTRGEIRRLIVSMPPRHGKSETISVHGPGFYLGRHPDRSVIFSTYSQDFADDFGRKVRNLLANPLHRRIFPRSKVSEDSAAISKLSTTAGGGYFAVGRGSGITGRGADLLIVDDPLKDREEASSATIRRQLQQWYAEVAFTRLGPGGAVIIISTRWHEDDLPGWLMREHAAEGWEIVNLPAFAESGDALGRVEGEALWPGRFPASVLHQIKAQLGSAAFAALYQQRPAAMEGKIFKREWWKFYREAPAFDRVVLSLDTAFKAGASNDYSVATVWGEAKTGYYLLDMFRARVEFPELQRVAESLAAKWNPSSVLVEDKASGQSLIQSLQRETKLPVLPVKVSTDKESRAHACTPLVESGRVFLPDGAPWLADYLDEMSSFPAAPHDDMVDSTTQALNHMRGQPFGGLLAYYLSLEAEAA